MLPPLPRRAFLQTLGPGVLALAQAGWAPADEKSEPRTYTFKTADKCAIKADVYGADEQTRPVAVWIHGGALIVGDRRSIMPGIHQMLLKAGYIVVSIDYRLAPETKLPGILDDVSDALRWVRVKGSELFHADPKRLAVLGGSAGGYLTLTTGYRVEPRPRVLVSYWGYGALVADWYTQPDDFYRKQPLVSKEEAAEVVGTEPLSEMPPKNRRNRFYLYCRQNGLWPRQVAGLDPVKDAKAFDPFCPQRNVKTDYPPTMLIHGTKDTDVPYAESKKMAEELERKKIKHDLITVEGGGHGLPNRKPEEIAAIHQRALDFIIEHTK
jgi:acetyl esterase/lipase